MLDAHLHLITVTSGNDDQCSNAMFNDLAWPCQTHTYLSARLHCKGLVHMRNSVAVLKARAATGITSVNASSRERNR
eukprot:15079928-Alexandrium_andersonii.AAC.1